VQFRRFLKWLNGMLYLLGRLGRRFSFWARRDQLSNELEEELQMHLQMKEAEGKRSEMGNLTLAKEESRDMWGFAAVDDLLRDARQAFRVFGRNPGFASIAIISLALGIAGTTAIFSLVNALLIRPLPLREPNRVVRITRLYPKALLEYLQQRSRTMEIALFAPSLEFNLTGNGPASRITGSETSANFFSVIGASVERGRIFNPGEDRPGKDHVIILSRQFWMTSFHGDKNILGRMITMNGVSRQVIGIAPASFSFPSSRVQFWIPARIDPADTEDYWGGEFVPLIGRLKPAVTVEQARNEIHSLAAGVWKLFPWPMPRYWNAESTLISLQSDLAGDTQTELFILLGAVGTVLIIACANVASLLLARATARRKEVAMRAALGAGTGRIIRQLLTESIVLALSAGFIGVLLGAASLSLFRAIVPADLPGMALVEFDWRVCSFAAALSILTGLSFGIVPALNAGRVDLIEAMRSGSQRAASKKRMALRSWLIAGEVALTVVLVVGAALLMKSLYDLTAASPGFNASRVLTVKVSPSESFCAHRESCIAFYDRLNRQARGLDGVVDSAIANAVPLDGQLPAIAADVGAIPELPIFRPHCYGLEPFLLTIFGSCKSHSFQDEGLVMPMGRSLLQ
jgi:predicted permease